MVERNVGSPERYDEGLRSGGRDDDGHVGGVGHNVGGRELDANLSPGYLEGNTGDGHLINVVARTSARDREINSFVGRGGGGVGEEECLCGAGEGSRGGGEGGVSGLRGDSEGIVGELAGVNVETVVAREGYQNVGIDGRGKLEWSYSVC